MKRDKTSLFAKIDKIYVWHPFTQMQEWGKEDNLIIERGEGNYLIDTDGRKYLDGVSSIWVNVHGHRKKEIDDAIKKQIDKISHSTLLGLGNIPSIELAEKLVNIAPKGLAKVFYSDNGSTAVEIALKMAFQYWQQKDRVMGQGGYPSVRRGGVRKTKPVPAGYKQGFVAFTGAYHGDTFGSMSVGEIDVFVKKYKPLLFRTFKAYYPYCYRCPIDKTYPSCKISCIKRVRGGCPLGAGSRVQGLEEILQKHHKEIAACIIEPIIQGAAGMIISPHGFLKRVETLCRKYNVLLIADEVAAGFGRTGKLFACEHEGVRPDFLCLAKGLTAGYLPFAATLTTDRIYNAFLGEYKDLKTFFHGHTYTGNQLGCSAAIANLEIFEKENVLQKVQNKIKLFTELLERLKGLKYVGDVRQKGLMAGIEIVEDKKTKSHFPMEARTAYKICMKAREHGLIIRPIGDTIIIMPSLSIKESELKRIVDIVYKCIGRITCE